MDYKLKAITNNVNNNDTVVDLISRSSESRQDAFTGHTCQRTVPVLFASIRGVHLRKFNKNSVESNYSITFCDLERWNLRNHVDSIGLTPPSSDRTAPKSIKIVKAKDES